MLAPEPNPVNGLPRRSPTVRDPFGVPHVPRPPATGAQTITDPFGVPRVQNPGAAQIGTIPTAPLLGGSFVTPNLGSTNTTTASPALPDYRGIIENDPIYRQTQQDIAAAHGRDQDTLDDMRKRALINFGDVPDLGGYAGLTGDLSGSISDLVRSLAGENTASGLSTTARINKAHNDAVDAVKSSLTARGLLSSGETGFQLGEQNDAYQRAGYDAIQQLVDFLSGGNRSFLDAEAQRRASLAQAASDAAGRIPPGTTPVAGGGGTGGAVGNVIDLTPEQQAGLQNGQFPLLNLPITTNMRAAPGFGQTLPLNAAGQKDVANGDFPALSFAPPPDPVVDLTPAQQQDVQSNDFPLLTQAQLGDAPANDPYTGDNTTMNLTPAQQADVQSGQFPQLNFPAAGATQAAAAAARRRREQEAAAAQAAATANRIAGHNL